MANGTIAFDTLQTSGQITGTAKSVDTDYVVNGSAKAWSTTSADGETINNSFNIATLTDVGTGQQQHNVTNNFANTNHVPTFSVANSYNQQWTSNLATSSWRTNNYGASYVDIEMRTLTLGDLA